MTLAGPNLKRLRPLGQYFSIGMLTDCDGMMGLFRSSPPASPRGGLCGPENYDHQRCGPDRSDWRHQRHCVCPQPSERHCSLFAHMLAKPQVTQRLAGGAYVYDQWRSPAQVAMPQIGVLAQYVKDFSFENPNAPRSMAPSAQQPAINIQVNVDAARSPRPTSRSRSSWRARLNLKVCCCSPRTDLCRRFRIQNVPADSLQPVILIECPRLLFPFAREIIATATRNGGFQPLLLNPIDFVALYRQRMAAAPTVPRSMPINPS